MEINRKEYTEKYTKFNICYTYIKKKENISIYTIYIYKVN